MSILTKVFYPLILILVVSMMFVPVTEAITQKSTKITVKADQSFIDQYSNNKNCSFRVGIGEGLTLAKINGFSWQVDISQTEISGEIKFGIMGLSNVCPKEPVPPLKYSITQDGPCKNFKTITLYYKKSTDTPYYKCS